MSSNPTLKTDNIPHFISFDSKPVYTLYGHIRQAKVSEERFPGSFQFQTTLTVEDFDDVILFFNNRAIRGFLAVMRNLYA